MKIKYIKITFMVALAASMMFSATPVVFVNAARTDTIKIGALGPLSITPGEDMKKGAELAVEQINAGAGVDVDGTAHDFVLQVESNSGTDGLPDITIAGTKLEKLATDGNIAMLGGFRTEVVMGGIMPNLATYGTPFLGVGSTAPIFTPYFWRVGPVNGSRLLMANVGLYLDLLADHDIKVVALAYEDAAWTAGLVGGYGKYLPLLSGGAIEVNAEIIAPIPQDATASSISTILDKVDQNDSIDAILTIFSAPVGKAVTEQWAAKGLNDKVMLAGINVESQKSTVFEDTDGASFGEIGLENAPPGVYPTTKTKAFIEAYELKFNERPTYTSYGSYDSVYILKDAIERADNATSAGIQDALLTTDYIGVSARMKFTNEPVEGQVKSLSAPLNAYANFTVHDLFTTSSYNVAGFPYPQPYFAQWQEDGTKVAIWPSASADLIKAPVLPPYGEESDEGLFPGYELFIAIFASTLMAIVVMNKRRKK